MKVYRIKQLIDGFKVKPELKGKKLVCCKATKGYTHIAYGNELTVLPEKPLLTLAFDDKFKKNTTYFLDYYLWNPTPLMFGEV